MGAHNPIGDRSGIDVAQVARQVRSTREPAQHMGLVATGPNQTDPNIVIELMLHQLDSDHTLRGIGYAYSNNARHLVLVASAFPQTALNLLNERDWVLKRKNVTIHLLRLETRQGSDGSAIHDLIPETPPGAIDRQETFLEHSDRSHTSSVTTASSIAVSPQASAWKTTSDCTTLPASEYTPVTATPASPRLPVIKASTRLSPKHI